MNMISPVKAGIQATALRLCAKPFWQLAIVPNYKLTQAES